MGAPADFTLPEDFWTSFFADHWDRTPLLLRAPLDVPLVTTEEIFEAITRRKRPETKLRFYVENTLVVGDDKAYLPVSGDGSMAGYARRIDQQLGHRRFGVVADDFTASHFGTWSRLRQFLRAPLTRLGLPAGGGKIHLTVFLGNYASTPFGIHVDSANVFLFVVEGAKRMSFWPGRAPHGAPMGQRADDPPSLDDALQLEAQRGDLIFWPTGYQHVGEAIDGELSVTASLGLFVDGNDADTVWSAARGIVERAAAPVRHAFYPGEPARPEELASRLPESILRARDALRKVRSLELDRSLLRSWATLVTAYGFRTPPPLRDSSPLSAAERVRGDPSHPIVRVTLPGRRRSAFLAANGRGVEYGDSRALQELLVLVNGGEPLSVEGIVDRFGPEALVILEWLDTVHAIERL